jgi:gluconokinase
VFLQAPDLFPHLALTVISLTIVVYQILPGACRQQITICKKSMNYYLGVDIGTTSAKAVAFSEKGEVMANHSFAYDMSHPRPGWSEQDPNTLFDAVINGVKQALKTLAPQLPLFVSFSAAMHSLIAIDRNGNLLTNCIIWADNRADELAQQLRNSQQGNRFYQLSGVPVHSMSPLSKLLWLRQHEPAIFEKAFKFIGIKEYIFFRLFNDFVVDTSIASATGLLNIDSLQWDQELLSYAGITTDQLSKVVSTKTILFYENTFPGLIVGGKIPFVIGSSDGALSNLGTGATSSNAMAMTIGTSGAARMVVPAPSTDPEMRTFCYHLKDQLYIAGGANNNGAVVLQWLKEDLLQVNDDFEALCQQAAAIPAGCDGLLILPYILGERAPIWNANAKGVFFGLTIQHTKAHLVRACLEGVIFSIYSIAKVLAERHDVREIRASGGFAKSPLWLQILADVSNIRVLVSDTVESSALGAVMLGAEAMETGTHFDNETTATYTPDAAKKEIYRRQFKKFEHLYDLLKGEMINESNMQ